MVVEPTQRPVRPERDAVGGVAAVVVVDAAPLPCRRRCGRLPPSPQRVGDRERALRRLSGFTRRRRIPSAATVSRLGVEPLFGESPAAVSGEWSVVDEKASWMFSAFGELWRLIHCGARRYV